MHICITWDPKKAWQNERKHRISFTVLEPVFSDPYAITIEDPDARGEARWITLGADMLGRVIVVTYTYRDNTIRIISARTATAREKRQYEEGI